MRIEYPQDSLQVRKAVAYLIKRKLNPKEESNKRSYGEDVDNTERERKKFSASF